MADMGSVRIYGRAPAFGRRVRPQALESRRFRFYSIITVGTLTSGGVLYAAMQFLAVHDIAAVALFVGATALWGFAFSK